MTDKTCKTCEHWKKPGIYSTSKMGECTGVGEFVEADVSCAMDTYMGYELMTHPDFGCIKHEEKESEK